MDNIVLPQAYAVTGHTDFVGPGSTFVAISGSRANGLSYIPQALQKGASKIVIERGVSLDNVTHQLVKQYKASVEVVDDTRAALAELSARSLGYPAKKLKIIGVTGTKGKTSSSYMIYHMLRTLGKKVALSTTVEKLIDDCPVRMALTTPLPDQLHVFFNECVRQEIEYVVLEVSAQALSLHRVDGITFAAGLFTNFSMEHMEFYSDMNEYFKAKSLLVSRVKDPSYMLINIDDQYGRELKKLYPLCSSFSFEDKGSMVYGWSHVAEQGIVLHVKVSEKTYMFQSLLLGKFNAYNLLGALSVIHALGLDLQDLMLSMTSLKMIPGRMEQYLLKNQARVFIDYAHNPSSFEAVLSTLRHMTKHLIVVFGAGGCRDKQKRPMMGAIAQKYCDIVVLTSDNPRDEDPIDIIHDIEQGIVSDSVELYRELNRTKAIELSYTLSHPKSIIAVLGKGRDEYQIVGDLTFPFKERSIIKKFILEQ